MLETWGEATIPLFLRTSHICFILLYVCKYKYMRKIKSSLFSYGWYHFVTVYCVYHVLNVATRDLVCVKYKENNKNFLVICCNVCCLYSSCVCVFVLNIYKKSCSCLVRRMFIKEGELFLFFASLFNSFWNAFRIELEWNCTITRSSMSHDILTVWLRKKCFSVSFVHMMTYKIFIDFVSRYKFIFLEVHPWVVRIQWWLQIDDNVCIGASYLLWLEEIQIYRTDITVVLVLFQLFPWIWALSCL